jgi:hypothetical protein
MSGVGGIPAVDGAAAGQQICPHSGNSNNDITDAPQPASVEKS